MLKLSQLEEIVNGVSSEASNSVWDTLEDDSLTTIEKYQQVLECIVFDILKRPKK